MCDGDVCDDDGLPSPKFHEYTGEPEVVLEKLTVSGPHPLVGEGEKFTVGAGAIVTEIVVSSLQ